ncbi:uncharacterized protein DNG_00246 [Cephalotrichum gorgonifer]|uniref:Uncharacterized protein n=1 Tax=Cephalotrichum gorgonifer TaxID=2041049 RepID=A0AAE8MP21_9PEZI|nr:uncharacterized protein DNG_00246 [Cephalotrichum gorgonifer]
MAAPEVSHGRGGAGNINPDDTQYVDGEVVRVGVEGSHGDGAFSTGRGGSGNIGDAKTTAPLRGDKEVIPEAAIHPAPATPQDYHTGRGGAGNEHVASSEVGSKKSSKADETESAPEKPVSVSLADKLKGKLFGGFKKK